ncbi:MAG: endo-1,4-beta-xylanase [Drouetiella hepatica Uher 2000/2452]|uniref:Beta-xylanase n=1 Tax=Drouetiella hepatica Uher 2000/2452 TaxID=904376 RepID=A0A951QAK2_9CYAN|nr:endo-1,4-beta-xylanase [Drouetiella hepatica Uher 2000/2452]
MSDSSQSEAAQVTQQKFAVNGTEDLRDRAARKGLIFGSFSGLDYDKFAQNSVLQSTFIRECNLIVAGVYATDTRPDINRFNLSSSDGLAQFAAQHKLLFRGHPLVWHEANPEWLKNKLNDPNASYEEVRNLLVNNVSTIVQRYAGQVHSWDVVNEAIEPGDRRSDSLRITPWFKRLGPDYIELAFWTAAEADPRALLVYNDNGLEYDTSYHDQRRDGVLRLLSDLKSKNVPVKALGIQAHLNQLDEKGNRRQFNPDKMRSFLQEVANLGLKILITELDVTDQSLPADLSQRDRIVAETYGEFLSVVLEQPAVIAIITWGLSDAHSWLIDFAPRSDGLPVRSLPFDADFNRKLAWNAIAIALDNAPIRML